MAKPKKCDYATAAEFTADIDRLVTLQIRKAAKTAALELQINSLRDQAKADLDTLESDIKAISKKVSRYAIANQSSLLPDGKRSTTTTLAEWGIRKTPDAVTTLPGIKQGIVITRLLCDKQYDYLNVATTLNKTTILSDMSDEDMVKYGLCISSTDEFYLNPRAAK